MTKQKKSYVEIFTDGACSGNPGPGGYGIVLKHGDSCREISGYEQDTTNNRMELMAVIEALKVLKKPCRIKIVSDSSYVIKGMTEWIEGWQKKNWMNSQKNPVLNRDLWEMLLKYSNLHEVDWVWVKGHHGHIENERCDSLAREAIINGKGIDRVV
ncbi:ribonuclease HI [Thermodesulfobacteriota bacterium]